MKIISYGVRAIEENFFHQLNKYNYQLTLVSELLTDHNVHLCDGYNVVMLRGNCKADRQNLIKMKELGIEYILTRTVGFDHIDLKAVKELGFKLCARVPAYSPNAVSELAVSLALGFTRKVFDIVHNSSSKDFRALDQYFSHEIRLSTVGIIGMGRIGAASAKAFKGLGARILAVDPHANDLSKELAEMTDLDTLSKESDVVIIHAPYIKDQNYHLINEHFIKNMKKGSFLINVARGELVDIDAVLNGIESGHLGGVALDVVEGESAYFFKNFQNKKIPDPIIEKLVSYYPKVIITPHLGSFTDEALTNMIEISYQNLDEFLTHQTCKNSLV